MAGFEPAFSNSPSWRITRLSYILNPTSIPETPAGVEPASDRVAADRLAIQPRRRERTRAGGGTRTHLVRVTRAVPVLSSSAGLLQQPVLVSSQLDRGSKPQSPPEGLANSRSCRSRTRLPAFVEPALEAARQPAVPHARVELASQPSEGRCLEPQDRAQWPGRELNPHARWAQPFEGRVSALSPPGRDE